jgi:hypothetical protein
MALRSAASSQIQKRTPPPNCRHRQRARQEEAGKLWSVLRSRAGILRC